MADNVTITKNANSTPPPDTIIATDDVGRAQYQRMKVDLGGDGASVPLVGGQLTSAASLPVVLASDQSSIPVSATLTSELSAFGEVITAHLTPRVALTFSYNINTELATTALTGSGTATSTNRLLTLSTTAATSSSASLSSRRLLDYQPGIGALARFTALFTAGAAGSNQFIGVGDATDGFFFGDVDGTKVVIRRSAGVDYTAAQASWNRDPADGTGDLPVIDFTKGNVFQIRYQWLGFGMIRFYIENPATGGFVLCHAIEYANTATAPSVENPSFPLYAFVENTTNNTNIVLKSASMGGYLEGQHTELGIVRAAQNRKLAVTTTLTNILTIRNKSTFASVTNRMHVRILELSVDADGTKAVDVKLIRGATLGGSPSYTDVSTSTSVIDFDVAGTTVTGGVFLKSITLAKLESKDLEVAPLDIELFPGETLTFAAAASSATSDIGVAVTWRESL